LNPERALKVASRAESAPVTVSGSLAVYYFPHAALCSLINPTAEIV